MKIAFLCGCLEPGRDGVGDYTRRLGVELTREGHEAVAIALTDPYVHNCSVCVENTCGANITTLRIPSTWSSKQRFKAVEKYLNIYDPQWLSLQFVPFAFHVKGLPFRLGNQLVTLGKGRLWHIMFHELWVGIESDASVKHTVWGFLQKRLVLNLINLLRPRSIHTHNHTYRLLLLREGIMAEHLPLFSNIPLHNMFKEDEVDEGRRQEILSFILFGAIHPNSPVNDFVEEAVAVASLKKKQILITFIGRSGQEIQRWQEAFAKQGIPIRNLGEQSFKLISEELARATVGISTTPLALAEKSGTVAAMFAHKLPVICVSKSWQAKGIKSNVSLPGLMEYKKGNLESCLSSNIYNSTSSVFEISRQFTRSLLSS